tara:strand:- start:1759 stop:2169 length:411 start_codon:yes stop_codon:yes gene_type:complete
MSYIDAVLGRGGIDARFTDWDTARNFVIFETIVPNPRLTDEEKVRLQSIEQDAFDMHSGQWTVSETQEIGEYYNMLRNSFPSATNDTRFLAIFEAADSVKASESSVGASDLEIPRNVSMGVILVSLAGLGYLLTRR